MATIMHMKRILPILLLMPTMSFALSDRELNLQFSRTDQLMGRIQEDNDRLKGQVRSLERDNKNLQDALQELQYQMTQLSDDMLKFRNVELSNLKAGQTRLYDQIPVLNWGTETRACKGLGEHQQIKVTQSPDGSHTLRYLCFDGRPLHLGTEVHSVPK